MNIIVRKFCSQDSFCNLFVETELPSRFGWAAITNIIINLMHQIQIDT